VKKGLVSLVFSFHLTSLAIAGVKTDLQKEGLTGPVQTVLIETAQFSNESGQWIEGPRELSARITYDVRGNKTAVIGNDATGKTTYTYDAQGNRTGEVYYGSDGTLYETLGYIYDDKGKLNEITSYGSDGQPLGRHVAYTYDDKGNQTGAVWSHSGASYTYDSDGHLIEETVHSSGQIRSRLVHVYDAQGHRVSTTSYASHDPGLGIEKVVTTYDARGNTLEQTTYYTQRADEPERPVPPPAKRVYTYEWDAHGNWTKQTQTFCSFETGKLVCESSHLSTVTYRTITYYCQPAGRSARKR